MRILQMLTPQRPDLTARLVRAAGRAGATAVLDLEDGLWDPQDERRTPLLKAAGRERLVELVRGHLAPDRVQVGVRVNRPTSPEFRLDAAALAECPGLSWVVLPKVETAGEIQRAAGLLAEASLAEIEIVPIVETRAGLANLDRIVEGAAESGVRWVAFGYYDFALDSGWWPFPSYFRAEYRALAGPFMTRVEAAGLGFVQPPHVRLADPDSLEALLSYVGSVCRREFGVLTVNSRQSALAAAWRGGRAETARAEATPGLDPDPAQEARRVVEAWERHRKAGLSFAVDARADEFITPHAYVAARAYLAGRDS